MLEFLLRRLITRGFRVYFHVFFDQLYFVFSFLLVSPEYLCFFFQICFGVIVCFAFSKLNWSPQDLWKIDILVLSICASGSSFVVMTGCKIYPSDT